MKSINKILVLIILIVVFFHSYSQIKREPFTPKTSILFINNQPQHKTLFLSLGKKINPLLQKQKNKYFSSSNISPVIVEFISDKREWRNLFIKYPFSEWGNGLAIPNKNKVYILLENNTIPQITETLIHEWLHIALQTKFNKFDLPIWFEEGVAQKLSNKKLGIPDFVFLSNKIIAKKILTFQQMDSVIFFGGTKVRLTYLQSLLAINEMQEILGTIRVDEKFLLNSPKKYGTFKEYFKSIANYSEDAYESMFLEHIKNKYKWFFIFNLENLMFIFVLIILFGAYYHIRYKNRKILEEWEEQEKGEIE